MMSENNVIVQMAKLDEAVEAARSRLYEIETSQAQAVQAAQQASAELAEFERHGSGRPAERQKLEDALAKAKAEANAPWQERQQGARAGLRDAEAELQVFTAEHLRELVVPVEERGAEAVADMVSAAQLLLDAHARRAAAEQELGGLMVKAGHLVHPSDVGPPSRAGGVVHEALRLVEEGEPAPVVRRYPGEPLQGKPAEAMT